MMDEPPEKKITQFLPGNKASPGRRGARNRLHADFIVAAQEHFEEVGKKAFEIVYRESPKEYLRIILGVLPREYVLEDGRLDQLGDIELEQYLSEIRRLRSLGIGQDRGRIIDGTISTEDQAKSEG
jgi:hypothetical protein